MTLRWPSLTAARRARDLEALGSGVTVDVLVVGGGIVGVGVALDAASRGLTVALVERDDLASGTSRWSSKLVHGGLRYLATGNVGIAHESAVERGILMQRTAPHLTRALPMLMPELPEIPGHEIQLARLGFVAGDVLRMTARTSRHVLPGPRRVSAVEARALLPGLRGTGLTGAVLSFDGQLSDDARLVVGVARTAASFGARIITRAEALSVHASGARVRDRLTDRELDVTARVVVNATGVWAGELEPSVRLRPSRGSHLVVSSARLGDPRAALTVPVPGKFGSYAFVLPQWDGRAYVGITDVPIDALPDGDPVPDGAEIDFLLNTVNPALASPLRNDDIIGVYAGLRPLLDSGGSDATSDLSRQHKVLVGRTGVVTVLGGKLTTYRRMAEDAVDMAIVESGLKAGSCRTRNLPLIGAASRARLAQVQASPRLVARYGVEAERVLAEADGDPSLLEPVAPGVDVIGAELAFAVRHELALDESDLLDRRTRIGLVPGDRQAALPAASAALDRADR